VSTFLSAQLSMTDISLGVFCWRREECCFYMTIMQQTQKGCSLPWIFKEMHNKCMKQCMSKEKEKEKEKGKKKKEKYNVKLPLLCKCLLLHLSTQAFLFILHALPLCGNFYCIAISWLFAKIASFAASPCNGADGNIAPSGHSVHGQSQLLLHPSGFYVSSFLLLLFIY